MDAAIVFTYGRPAVGREKLAFEAFQDGMSFFGKLSVDGRCEAPISFMGPAGGMMIVPGERNRLDEILVDDEFQRLYFTTGYSVPDLRYELMVAGDKVVETMGNWARVGSELQII